MCCVVERRVATVESDEVVREVEAKRRKMMVKGREEVRKVEGVEREVKVKVKKEKLPEEVVEEVDSKWYRVVGVIVVVWCAMVEVIGMFVCVDLVMKFFNESCAEPEARDNGRCGKQKIGFVGSMGGVVGVCKVISVVVLGSKEGLKGFLENRNKDLLRYILPTVRYGPRGEPVRGCYLCPRHFAQPDGDRVVKHVLSKKCRFTLAQIVQLCSVIYRVSVENVWKEVLGNC